MFCLAIRNRMHLKSVTEGLSHEDTGQSWHFCSWHFNNLSVWCKRWLCVLCETLQNCHSNTGFPSDICHNPLEGLVLVELCICLQELFNLSILLHKQRDRFFCVCMEMMLTNHTLCPDPWTTKGDVGVYGHVTLDC